MNLLDFKKVASEFGNGTMYMTPVTGGMGKHTIYSFKFGNVIVSFNGIKDAIVRCGNFKYVDSTNMYGIKNEGKDVLKISTREGLVTVLSSLAHEQGIEIGTAYDVNNKIVNDILAEVNPFESVDRDAISVGEFDSAIKGFDDAVNPYNGKTIDDVDVSKYPLNLSITGGKRQGKDNEVVLEVKDLRTNNSVRYTKGDMGVSYRLNCTLEDGTTRLETIHNSSNHSERIIIRVWKQKLQILAWDYDMTTGILSKSSTTSMIPTDKSLGDEKSIITDAEKTFICDVLNDDAREYALDITGGLINKGKSRK